MDGLCPRSLCCNQLHGTVGETGAGATGYKYCLPASKKLWETWSGSRSRNRWTLQKKMDINWKNWIDWSRFSRILPTTATVIYTMIQKIKTNNGIKSRMILIGLYPWIHAVITGSGNRALTSTPACKILPERSTSGWMLESGKLMDGELLLEFFFFTAAHWVLCCGPVTMLLHHQCSGYCWTVLAQHLFPIPSP